VPPIFAETNPRS